MEQESEKINLWFSEIDIFVSKVQEKSDVFCDTISNKKKMAWGELQNSVNAASPVPRTLEEVKKKWDEIKRSTKKRDVKMIKDHTVT